MMVRRVSLLVPVLFAIAAVSTASAQPRQDVGPWSTLERVGAELEDRREERTAEAADRIEASHPSFFAANAERFAQPLLLLPVRLESWPASPSVPAPVPPAPSATPAVVPHQPLVLGSLFGLLGSANPMPVPTPVPAQPVVLQVMPTPAPAPAPEPVPAPQPPAPAPGPAPVVVPVTVAAPVQEVSAPQVGGSVAPSGPADAAVNFGDGPYPGAVGLASGTPGAWHASPVVGDAFGGTPDDQAKASFKAEVLAKVEKNFRKSGIDVSLTTDPAAAPHTLSVVSGALAKDNPAAIGIADIGGDGFTFLDAFDPNAIDSVDDLENAVANNVSHELMHAFGVDRHDETGVAIDSGTIGWDLLTRDDLTFSGDAVALLGSADFQSRWDDGMLAGLQHAGHDSGCSCQLAGAMATPEPTTVVLWTMALVGVAWSGKRLRTAR